MKPGAVARLGYTGHGDSGHVTTYGSVLAGKRSIAYFEPSAAGSFRWHVPKSVAAPLKFCVEALDLSGNESKLSCAVLRIA